jgi:hypothetical protein
MVVEITRSTVMSRTRMWVQKLRPALVLLVAELRSRITALRGRRGHWRAPRIT